jgi:hypothetical protein
MILLMLPPRAEALEFQLPELDRMEREAKAPEIRAWFADEPAAAQRNLAVSITVERSSASQRAAQRKCCTVSAREPVVLNPWRS